MAFPPICKQCSPLNSKFILWRTRVSRSSKNWVIGVLVGSFLSLFATANIPSRLGILVYKLDISRVHNIAPSGICPRLLIFLMKSCVSLV